MGKVETETWARGSHVTGTGNNALGHREAWDMVTYHSAPELGLGELGSGHLGRAEAWRARGSHVTPSRTTGLGTGRLGI